MLDCHDCPQARKQSLACPDLGLTRPKGQELVLGGLGLETKAPHKFESCIAYWKREPFSYDGLPWAADVRSAYTVAVESRYAFDHGSLAPLHRLPGKLHDAIMLLVTEEGRIERTRIEKHRQEAKADRKGGTTYKIV